MKFITPLALGLLLAVATALELPADYLRPVAWAVLWLTIALSVVDVLVWQIVKALDDYVTRFQGPSAVLEQVLNNVWMRKRDAFVLFLINFFGRAFSATVMGAVTAAKMNPSAHIWVYSLAVGATVASLPLLLQQIVSYFIVSHELGRQLLTARREIERAEQLKEAALRPAPMTASDEHTSGYTKVVPWKE